VQHRVIVTNFEAALRVVRAGLAVSLVPREVAQPHADAGLRLIPLAEAWAERRFIVCYRDAASLTPSAQALVEHLAALASP
jgi:DNA-binding transcriptional LysR family regulator